MWQPSILQHQLQTPEECRLRFSRRDGIQYSVVAALAAALMLIARLLHPSPEGFGTHQQLGLPPCAFLYLTGIPCPSCGLTTSVAYAARLNFYESVITQPFGLIVFISAAMSIPLSVYFICRRVPWPKITGLRGRKIVIYLLIALFVISWIYKIAAMKGLLSRG